MLRQLYQDTSYAAFTDNNRVAPEWGCNPFLSDSINTASNSICGKVMFSQACVKNSVHRAEVGWLPVMHHRSHDQGGLHPLESACRGYLPAGGHPTGMHSCFQ